MSPLAPQTTTEVSSIITITDDALAELVKLRDSEEDAASLGLRLEIVSGPGEEFKYDLSFEIVTQAAFSDEVRTINGLKIIIPLASFEHINGGTLDYSERQGLIIRNPNKPPVAMIEGLVNDDEFSAAIETVISVDVNPALASHGGFVTFVGHDTEGVAYLTMGGGCHGCSMSKMTMLEGVQTTLIEQVPGVLKVRDITDHAAGANPYYS